MRQRVRAEFAARAILTLGALLPYWRLLTFKVIYVTDDRFTSDIFNGELPGRVLVSELIRQGRAPTWTNQLCSGVPLAGTALDPVGLAAFSVLPTTAALDLFVVVLLLIAAHGAYGLARRLGADRPGAILAGVAFAGSGYIACQLKHLGIVSTIVWLPVGLALIDRALDGDAPITLARRALFMAAFGLVFAEQVLCGFPQSAYICALVYGGFALFRAIADRRRPGLLFARLARLGGLGAAALLGAAAGAVVLLPLSALGRVSDRAEPLGWTWSTQLAYWPPNVLTFLLPYFNGDISTNSYTGHSLFWEDYGYVGLATILLAVFGGVRERRRTVVMFLVAMTLVAYLLVLGPATPVFGAAYVLVPRMDLFRFPTRFLIVVELGLALLGAIGLTRLGADLERRMKRRSRLPRLVAGAVCLGTALDLFVHQPRQNPMVPGQEWLALPQTARAIQADSAQPRTFTPRHSDLHSQAFHLADGWTTVAPYFQLREVLEPNVGGGFWNTPSADCYSGIAPRWHVDVWGDHNRDGIMSQLAALDFDRQTLHVRPALIRALKTYGVSHLLSPFPQHDVALTPISSSNNAYVYRIVGATRTRFVRTARHGESEQVTVTRLLNPGFDPDEEILLAWSPDSIPRTTGDSAEESGHVSASAAAHPTGGRAVVTRDDSSELVIEAEAPENGFLLLADTYYPGWTATVDGTPTPIYRANLSVRGIELPKGRHQVRFTFEAPGFRGGLRISIAAVSALLIWAVGAAYLDRRAFLRRHPGPVGVSN
jgi:hypothetical protein